MLENFCSSGYAQLRQETVGLKFAKVGVEGSNPFARSKSPTTAYSWAADGARRFDPGHPHAAKLRMPVIKAWRGGRPVRAIQPSSQATWTSLTWAGMRGSSRRWASAVR